MAWHVGLLNGAAPQGRIAATPCEINEYALHRFAYLTLRMHGRDNSQNAGPFDGFLPVASAGRTSSTLPIPERQNAQVYANCQFYEFLRRADFLLVGAGQRAQVAGQRNGK